MSAKKKLYVGCALQGAPVDYTEKVKGVREGLKEHFNVLEFLFPHPGTDQDVYALDILRHVDDCDFMLAIADFPSTGLGWEMGAMVEKHKKPLIICAEEKSLVSRLVLGADVRPYVRIERYSSLDEVVNLTLAFEKSVVEAQKPNFRLHPSAKEAGFKLHEG